MKLESLLLAGCLLGVALPGNAQTTELRRSFDQVSGWIVKAAEAVPADKYGWRPVETVRTFGQLVAHVADEINYYTARAAGRNVEWSDAVEKGATDKATVVQKLKQAVAAGARGTRPGRPARSSTTTRTPTYTTATSSRTCAFWEWCHHQASA